MKNEIAFKENITNINKHVENNNAFNNNSNLRINNHFKNECDNNCDTYITYLDNILGESCNIEHNSIKLICNGLENQNNNGNMDQNVNKNMNISETVNELKIETEEAKIIYNDNDIKNSKIEMNNIKTKNIKYSNQMLSNFDKKIIINSKVNNCIKNIPVQVRSSEKYGKCFEM